MFNCISSFRQTNHVIKTLKNVFLTQFKHLILHYRPTFLPSNISFGTKNWVSTLHVEKQTKSSNTASHWSISASSLNRVKRGRWLAEIRWRQSRPLLSWVCSANEPSKVLCGASCSKFLAGIVSTCCWCWCIILAGLEDRPSPHSSRIKNPYTYEKVIHLKRKTMWQLINVFLENVVWEQSFAWSCIYRSDPRKWKYFSFLIL